MNHNTIFKKSATTFIIGTSLLLTACNDYRFAGNPASAPPPPPAAQEVPPTTTPTTPLPPNDSTNPIAKTESFFIPESKADILFVVDVSGSMSPDLKKIGEKLKSLTSNLGKVNWQVGVTNADIGHGFFKHRFAMNGHLMNMQGEPHGATFLKKSDVGSDLYFLRTLSHDGADVTENTYLDGAGNDNPCFYQPYCQSAPPVPLKALITAMTEKDHVANAGFFRSQSYLVPIIVSDADENERGGEAATQPAEVVSAFQATLGKTMRGLVGFSLIVKPGDAACLSKQRHLFQGGWFGKYGNVINSFTKATKGDSLSICTNDFGTQLSEISQKIAEKFSQIELAYVPEPTSIQVRFAPATGITWKVDGQKIIFNSDVPANTQVTVNYTVKK